MDSATRLRLRDLAADLRSLATSTTTQALFDTGQDWSSHEREHASGTRFAAMYAAFHVERIADPETAHAWNRVDVESGVGQAVWRAIERTRRAEEVTRG